MTAYESVDLVHKIGTSGYNEQVILVSRLLRAVANKVVDLVEQYADVWHDHGIPSFIHF